jgi:Domain of unknown function (DUF4262)
MTDHDWNKFRQITDTMIARTGRSIVAVFGGEGNDEFPFAYTIGNYLKGLPELLVIGTYEAGFLNDLSRLMVSRGAAFGDGQMVTMMGARQPVKLIRAGNVARTEYAVQAGEHFGHDDYSIMQVLISDKEGQFPGEKGCQEPYSRVPVLRLE